MKRLYTLFSLAIALPFAANAQISIGQAEMPAANDQLVRVRAVANPFLNYNATGPAHTWDFDNLAANQGDTTRYQTVASTNFVYAIAYADLFFNPNRANHAKQGVDIPFSNLLPIENPFTFRHRSNSAYKTVGFGVELSGIPLPIFFDEQDVIYELPLNYGDASSSHSAYHIEIPNVGYYGFEQDRENLVDGWGSITTPGGSWDVLRVKTTLTMRDTLSGFAIDRPVAREYKWLAEDLRVPVLQINTTAIFGIEVISGVWYYDVPRTITVDEPLASTLCPGAEFDVFYTATGAYNAGGFFIPANYFVAELSDASGSFAAPVEIGSVQATASGSIAATIPANTPPGSGYRIRVLSTSPDHIGTPSAMTITIGGATTAAISASGSPQICQGGSLLLTAVGGPGYQWQLDGADIDGATSTTYEANQPGSYTVQVSNGCGEATSNAIVLVVNDPPQPGMDATDITICSGEEVVLLGSDQNEQPGTTYQWYLNEAPIADANGLQFAATLQGQYTLGASNSVTGCSAVSGGVFVTVDEQAPPELTADGSTTFCAGGSVLLTASSAQATSFVWTLDGNVIDGAVTASLNADASGTYAASGISTNSCASPPASIVVVENAQPDAPIVSVDGDQVFCAGGSVTLNASGNAGTWQWSLDGEDIADATDATLVATEGGTYSVVLTSAEGCTSTTSAAVEVVTLPLPEAPGVVASEPTTFCAGGGTSLLADLIDGASYQWSLNGTPIDGATTLEYSVLVAGTYTVTVTDGAGCSATSDPGVDVVVLDAPAQPVIIQVDGELQASGGGEFQWFLEGQPISGANAAAFQPTENGNYSVTVTDANGCSSLSEEWFFLTTSINAASAVAHRVFPDPNAGLFTLEVNGQTGRPYEVRDLTGKLVHSGTVLATRTTVDLGSATEGAYFLRLPGAGEAEVIRFMIVR